MLPRTFQSAEADAFRDTVRRFFEEEVAPQHVGWEERGFVDRAIWKRAGELGLLCLTIPEEYGGAGADRRYCAILMEELARARVSGMSFLSYTEVFATYVLRFGTEAQRRQWLPRIACGEIVCCVAMTEPGTGSDLQAITTRARRDGDDYVIDGAKTFISYGSAGDLYVVALKTRNETSGKDEISLMLVEGDRPGFTKGQPLAKIGLRSQDLCELRFDQVRVPCANLLGTEGRGMAMLMQELAWERIMIAIPAVASAERALADTVAYTRERKAFGQAVSDFQHNRFALAEMKSEIAIGQAFVDRCVEAYMDGSLSTEAAAAAKLWCTELLCRTVDRCLQLHGGYGYMEETPIARAWRDARVSRIYAGTNEIMREIVARSL
ncbi:acyl-CoA dehydrogenase family protein [Nevskia sp.]|uniref:acyl-CoA dehydrogenase family protein n=1 Tax=Nevskia sp. TaxID=1929292 RepID=UPI0025EDFB12|nr:acyl-CoA dehydrogenase family protein [Nevskia sp.]